MIVLVHRFWPEGVTPDVGALTWDKPKWFDIWAAEHKAVREGVGMVDMSFMSKFLVQGRDAGKFLNKLSTANVDGALNTITYTQWLDDSGKMQADLTVTKLANDKFMVVVTDTMHRHAETWMKRHLPESAHAFITDVSGAYAQINIQGPRSRELMSKVTETDMSNDAYPFRAAKYISIGYAAKVTSLLLLCAALLALHSTSITS
jgi:glycine cleavage system aminomethyltransferase T